MHTVCLSGIRTVTVKLKLFQNIDTIRNITNCYWHRLVRIPLYLSTDSTSTHHGHNSGHSVVESLEHRVRPHHLYRYVNNRSLSTVVHRAVISNNEMTEIKPFERLPKTVVPKHYQLTLMPDLKSFSFDGEVNITIVVSS